MKMKIAVLILVLGVMLFPYVDTLYGKSMGVLLANTLYTYSPYKTAEQDEAMQKLLSKEMYQRLTISSDQRQMRVYLKYRGEPATCNIISVEKNRIVYSLDAPSIVATRTFQIEYKLKLNKVVEVCESELFYLPPSERSFYQ